MSRRPSRFTEAEARKAAKVAKAEGHVYFLQGYHTFRIKIGFSKNPKTRVASFAAGCPEPTSLIGTMPGIMADEKALHKKFRHIHIYGEWFEGCKELTTFIEENRARGRKAVKHGGWTLEDKGIVL